MAVGAVRADLGGVTNAGLVRLYGRNGTDWNMFQQMNGTGFFGYTLDLSHNSSTLVIASFNDVYIYHYNNATSVYDSFYNITNVNAAEVCVSGDGSTFGITTNNYDGGRIFV
eukprot:CAMPEP_0116060640 /NCGR_PEP_ID=MMETSP0322-20121206/6543_1 /TAXON_ID=163516 /ORGANISM="Leptocylindrus danicus var. apora, Strain B651" /LENGTH=111 /DNA_ID=CAMNT_0003545313 /DNA_START=653 /DNA_END=984 /DNA_ORIENTATION=-